MLHAEIRQVEKDFGLADACVLATARKLKSKVLTGDPHFKNVKEAVMINSLTGIFLRNAFFNAPSRQTAVG